MDIKSAYLNRTLQEEIYMEPPPSFDVSKGMIFHLIKAVYGTKQGRHIWYNDIQAMLQGMGYHCTTADHAVFTHTAGKLPSIIALYVDDITMVCKDLGTIQQDKATF
jgi:reverse transcriptase-like protein